MKLRALGLQRRPRKLWLTWSWEMAGSVVGLAVVATICAALGWKLEMWDCAAAGIGVATWLGRRLNQIPDYDAVRAEQLRD